MDEGKMKTETQILLEYIRDYLNREIASKQERVNAFSDNDFLKGRLAGLFFVLDHILYDAKSKQLC